MHLLAAVGDQWPDWITVPSNLAGVIAVALLWITGRITLASDANRRVSEAVEAEQRIAAQQVAAAVQLANEKARAADEIRRALEERLAAVVADRDAWRGAHATEVEARHTSEAVSAKALEASNVVVRLATALESALANMGRG